METFSKWKIYVGAFFDRFGDQKLAVLASTDATVQAAIKDCMVRQYIDLEARREELLHLLTHIVNLGYTIDPTAILDLEPVESEIWNESDIDYTKYNTSVVLADVAGVAYKTSYGFVAMSIEEDTPPPSYTERIELTSLQHQLVQAGAELVVKDDGIYLYKKVE